MLKQDGTHATIAKTDAKMTSKYKAKIHQKNVHANKIKTNSCGKIFNCMYGYLIAVLLIFAFVIDFFTGDLPQRKDH